MIKSISHHPTQKYVNNEIIYSIQREFKEICFVFNSEKKYVSLMGNINHFVSIEEERIDLPYLNYYIEIIASDNILIYADNGDYISYQTDSEGNIVYEDIVNEAGEVVGSNPIILHKERGIVGEYTFFEGLRNTSVTINSIIEGVISRADILGNLNK